jgi:WD40 repeat protein
MEAESLPQFVKFVVCLDHKVAVMTPGFFSLKEEETKKLCVLDMKTGLIHKLSGHTDWLSDCAVDQMGKVALSSALDNTLRVWDIENYVCINILEGHTGNIVCCALSPDGLRALAGFDDGTLRLWDTQTASCVSILKGHSNKVDNCVFSGDGRRVLSTGADNTLCLWDLVNDTLLQKVEYAVDTSFPRPCALDFEGHRVLYAAPGPTLHLIEMETGREITAFTFDAPINFISFSPQEDSIMVGDGSGHVHFLGIEEGMLYSQRSQLEG